MEQYSHYLPGILIAYGVMMIGMFSPGPNILSVIGTSMSVGRKQGKALAWGVSSGSLLWALLTWFGLTTVLTVYASVLVIIKFIGAGYLLWLAFKAFRSAASPNDMIVRQLNMSDGNSTYYRRGLLIQMTNPKAVLSWIAIMSFGLGSGAPFWVGLVIIAGTTLISFVGHTTYAVAFSTAPMVAGYRRARRWIEVGLGTFFCFAGYKLLTTKL